MSARRVKYIKNPICSYLVLKESEFDYKLECIDWVWKDDFIECNQEDLSNLPTATQLLIQLQKQGDV